MRCFHPWAPPAHMGLPPTLRLPCNQCVGCRLRRSAEWATRCMHEAKQHRYNSWITLTYDDKHLPSRYYTGLIHPRTGKKIYSGTLEKLHVQKFYRATRKSLSSKNAQNDYRILFEYDETPQTWGSAPYPRKLRPILRYYYGGEYGEKYHRPHYHICLFGIDYNDKKHVETTDAGFKLYESPTLAEQWKYGRHTIAELTWETAAYTARYIMKKITGQKQKKHYEKIDHETGEIITLEPEFNDMSRKPGIANAWFEKWKTDVYKEKTSGVRIRGKLSMPPRYYDKLYKRTNRAHHDLIKLQRVLDAREHWENNTQARRQAEEIITTTKIKTLKQKL